jgi:ubiquinone biosynthesis accessory factor UbiK
MIDTRLIDDALAALRAGLPADLTRDIERNLRGALTGMFERLDLVTREEFDVQQAVLARTRARLEQLERQVATLEKALLKK